MLQALPLDVKIMKSKLRIEEWYRHFDGKVYVSFSGGKDSTVLLHLVRSIYPDVEAVYVDTGLEYPEIREFVKTVDNVTWLRPKKSFKEVIEEYGYPIISKEVAQAIDEIRNSKNENTRNTRLNGNAKGNFKLSMCHRYLIDAPFKISNRCCYHMKKSPIKHYERKSKKKPFVGMLAEESNLRTTSYLRTGCNAFETKQPISNPLGFWKTEDIWEYLKKYDVPYSKVYDMGYDRTGCMFCMFGVHLESEPNRFQKMQVTHPKLYDYCINKLGLKKVLEYINVPYYVETKNNNAS